MNLCAAHPSIEDLLPVILDDLNSLIGLCPYSATCCDLLRCSAAGEAMCEILKGKLSLYA